ncbi:Sel1-like repeat-containing protein kinase family protein [Falsiroseomonas ponticola]|uniref:Sel1-like repeat-containing protein kinase family protein n=1 Tax=Falsiroseomonas ponticola TaxID=2786951 RepID=UPI0019319ABA|nr:Sel1-like repeat-containing protein kinase family protein [Roseomonas ponticola]
MTDMLDNLPGRRIGVFTLGPQLGRGAFGVVFRASAEGLAGDVAVKLLWPQGLLAHDPLRELRNMAQFVHPNIIASRGEPGIAALRRGDGVELSFPYFGMELAQQSLHAAIARSGPLAAAEARALLRDLATGLAWTKQAGFVHRDLHPGNILRTEKAWKISDLGLARTEVRGEYMFRRGAVRFQPPEVIEQPAPRAPWDVWSLGLSLVWALAGGLPGERQTVAQWGAELLRDRPLPLPALPAPFDAIAAGCLLKDPAKRWTPERILAALAGDRAAPAPAPAKASPPAPPTSPQAALRRAAEAGDAQAMMRLAVAHADGLAGLPADPVRGTAWFRRAAEAGHPPAMAALAERLEFGLGTVPDAAEARRWHRRAAEAGDPDAMVAFGAMLADGRGGPADERAAADWFARAAALDHVPGLTLLAEARRQGRGVAVNTEAARDLYARAAAFGDGLAHHELMRLHDTGEGGLPPDPGSAAAHAVAALRLGHRAALVRICDGGGKRLRPATRAAIRRLLDPSARAGEAPFEAAVVARLNALAARS